MKDSLPIDEVLDKLIDAMREGPVVLEAPPGAGKTTRVPPALLFAGLAADTRIWVLEPRRIAARLAATRVAQELGEPIGRRVGYTVRYDNRCSADTRIQFLTTGVALKILSQSPAIEHIGTIVFDEVHERQLDMDLLLAWAKHLRATIRPDLNLLAMSATLDTNAMATWMNAKRVRANGKAYPVEVIFRPASSARRDAVSLGAAVAQAIEKLPENDEGDVLVFLPGIRAIEQARSLLEPVVKGRNIHLTPLYAGLGQEGVKAALRARTQRQIFLATNIAESSVTLPKVRTVIDSGLARIPRTNPWTGLLHLDIGDVAKDSVIQRAGRAGRTAPGTCIRLFSEVEYRQRPDTLEPEICRMDLAALRLLLARLKVNPPAQLPWLCPPNQKHLDAASELLQRQSLLAEDGRITHMGQLASTLPCHPRLACILLFCAHAGYLDVGARIVALLESGNPEKLPRKAHPHSDIIGLMEANRFLEPHQKRVVDDLKRRIPQTPAIKPDMGLEECIGRALLMAFPDRLCRRQGGRRLARVGTGMAQLDPSSSVQGGEWLIGVVARPGTPARITLASTVDPDWLWEQPGAAEELTEAIEATWDSTAERVRAERITRYRGLPLDREQIPAKGLAETQALLISKVRTTGLSRITDVETLRQYRRRLTLANKVDNTLPTLTDDRLYAALSEVSANAVGFRDLAQADLLSYLRQQLTWSQTKRLETLVPLRIVLPNGHAAKVAYPNEGAPRISVRVQHVLGLTDGPRLANGRIPVLLELLAPNHRPVQLTDDLSGFWARTWPNVRKELRGRYPKHAWPEDPTIAPEPRRRRSDRDKG